MIFSVPPSIRPGLCNCKTSPSTSSVISPEPARNTSNVKWAVLVPEASTVVTPISPPLVITEKMSAFNAAIWSSPESWTCYPLWFPGHNERCVPVGYRESRAADVNALADPVLAAYYDRLRIVVRGDLLATGRFSAIVHLNLVSPFVTGTGQRYSFPRCSEWWPF